MGSLLKQRQSAGTWLYSILMFVVGLLMLSPFIYMISMSIRPEWDLVENPYTLLSKHWTLENYEYVFGHSQYFVWYWNSVRIVTIELLLKFFILTTAAYAFARLQFRGKNVIFLFLLAQMMIPSDTTVVARFLMYKYMGLLDTQWAVIFTGLFGVFFLFLLRQFFMSIPYELTEAAILDGCSHAGIYWRIMLPLTKPILITMVLFTFINTWNNFVEPFLFINTAEKQMVTVGLQFFQTEAGAEVGLIMAGACLITIIPMILFSLTQRFFVEGIAQSGIKG